jgi:hypothetical protein
MTDPVSVVVWPLWKWILAGVLYVAWLWIGAKWLVSQVSMNERRRAARLAKYACYQAGQSVLGTSIAFKIAGKDVELP